MKYTLHQLVIFLTVVEKQSITKAAEELHLTQPAVSIQLKNFQDQFDIPLTEVISRKLYITDFGKELAVAAQKVLDEMDEIRHMSNAYKGLLAGRLKIAVVSTGKYVMPYFLTSFLQKYPEVELTMDVTNRSMVLEALKSNKVDFALVSILPGDLSVERVELISNKLYMIRKSQDDGMDQPIRKKALENVPWIYREEGSATRKAMEKFISTLDLPLRKTMELTSNEAVKQAVLAGLGYSVMPLIGIRNELQNRELEVVPFKGLPVTTTWNLIWLKEKKLSPIAKAYLEHFRVHKDDTILANFQWYEDYQAASGSHPDHS